MSNRSKREYLEEFLTCFANSLRDMADGDYIIARMAFRAKIFPHFFWSAHQAMEKYLKGILLFNRIDAQNVSHSLSCALNLVPPQFELECGSKRYIDRIDGIGMFSRYPESSYNVTGKDLKSLDRTVWDVRRYCQAFTHSNQIASVAKCVNQPPQDFKICGGKLEAIIEMNIPAKESLAKESLIWINSQFGPSGQDNSSSRHFIRTANSPLALFSSEMLDELRKYIYLPKPVINAYLATLPK